MSKKVCMSVSYILATVFDTIPPYAHYQQRHIRGIFIMYFSSRKTGMFWVSDPKWKNSMYAN